MGALLTYALVAAVAGIAGWLLARSRSAAGRAAVAERLAGREREVARLVGELAATAAELARVREESASRQARAAELEATLASERRATEEKLRLLDTMQAEAQARLSDAFEALSAKALASNNESFLHLAKARLGGFQEEAKGDLDLRRQAIDELVRPLAESLVKVDQKIGELERTRAEAYGSLSERLLGLAQGQNGLERETAKLVNALRSPATRGRWGEIQLQRVVEMAGMQAHCDFTTQPTVSSDEGRLRPDLVIRLPNDKLVVVDSKAPLEGYLAALEAPDEESRRARLQDHARQLRGHLLKLAARGYAAQFASTPEFVVLFLPGESFFSAALEQDPSLIEFGAGLNVIVATPTTLIALLRAVHYGWRQDSIEKSAREVSRLGKELHERLRTFADHFAGLGQDLGRAVDAYNHSVGSLESRILPAARRFLELGAATGDAIPSLKTVDQSARRVHLADTAPPAALASLGEDEAAEAAH